MFSHVTIGASDFSKSFAFYAPLMQRLGQPLKYSDAQTGWAVWKPPLAERPLFVLAPPFDGRAASPGNGLMTALLAAERATVDACHALALRHGGSCEGPPGLRPQYHAHYYGAYFRDPEGNKLCVCCHDAPAQ